MTKKKAEATTIEVQVTEVEGTQAEGLAQDIVLFKINRNLTADEYEELQRRVRKENKRSGVRIVLVPRSVDASIEKE